jgi:hypothetical protein
MPSDQHLNCSSAQFVWMHIVAIARWCSSMSVEDIKGPERYTFLGENCLLYAWSERQKFNKGRHRDVVAVAPAAPQQKRACYRRYNS